MKNSLKKLFTTHNGQALTEYGLIAALLSVVAIVVIIETGVPVEKMWEKIEVALLAVVSGGE